MLRLVNLSKYYYSSTSAALGLRKINLELHKGEFVAITGESGSGKSTLLNVISGLDTYEEGEMYINNEETSYFDEHDWEEYRRKNIGFIYQNYNLIDSYTVLKNVMAALLIIGFSKKVAKEKALKYIDQVGLTPWINNRASKLSSGQKQRLAIARALAKESDIIIADEPTGNLDVENGKQIIEILHQLSKEKLVIIATHNIEEVEPYITRRVKLASSEVIDDAYVNNASLNEIPDNLDEPVVEKQSKNKIVPTFTFFNIFAQPRRTCILLLFFLICALSSIVISGIFLSNLDDTKTRKYNDEAFLNGEQTRIVVRHIDGSLITQEDLNYFLSIEKVVEIDKYDLANDVNYYYQEGIDYHFIYGSKLVDINGNVPAGDVPKFEVASTSIYLDKDTQYLRSATSLNDNNIKEGKKATGIYEVIVPMNSKYNVNDRVDFLFKNRRKSGIDQYIRIEMTVVGKTNLNNNQVYFSDAFMENMSLTALDKEEYIYIKYKKPGQRVLPNPISLYFTAILNPELKGFNVRFSEGLLSKSQMLIKDNPESAAEILYSGIFYGYIDHGTYKEPLQKDIIIDRYTGSKSTSDVVEISQELYDLLYDKDKYKSTQSSIYIEDYAYADQIVKELQKNDYEAVSVFKIGSTTFDNTKVNERIVSLTFSVVSLFVIFILEIIIIFSLLKFKKNDFVILKSIGMSTSVTHKINFLELILYANIDIILSIIIVYIVNATGLQYIVNIMKYYRFYHFIIIFLVNNLVTLLIGYFINRYLDKRIKITALRED